MKAATFGRKTLTIPYGAYIFNERARAAYEMEVDAMIDSAKIVGFIPDVKFASFRTEIAPMAFFVWGTRNLGESS